MIRPIGCDRQPPPGYDDIVRVADNASDQHSIDVVYDSWVRNLELELIGRHDCYKQDGTLDASHVGRDKEYRIVWATLNMSMGKATSKGSA